MPVDERMDKEAGEKTNTMEYYPSITNEEILPFAAIWMDLEGDMLSKTSQTGERQTFNYLSYM